MYFNNKPFFHQYSMDLLEEESEEKHQQKNNGWPFWGWILIAIAVVGCIIGGFAYWTYFLRAYKPDYEVEDTVKDKQSVHESVYEEEGALKNEQSAYDPVYDVEDPLKNKQSVYEPVYDVVGALKNQQSVHNLFETELYEFKNYFGTLDDGQIDNICETRDSDFIQKLSPILDIVNGLKYAALNPANIHFKFNFIPEMYNISLHKMSNFFNQKNHKKCYTLFRSLLVPKTKFDYVATKNISKVASASHKEVS